MSRYFIDRRAGCIAVRDRDNTDYDDSGLHGYTRGVVAFWHGLPVQKKCEHCGHVKSDGWILADGDVAAAESVCARLNDEAAQAAKKALEGR